MVCPICKKRQRKAAPTVGEPHNCEKCGRPLLNQKVEQRISVKTQGRNEKCACDSGKKYKKCCGFMQV